MTAEISFLFDRVYERDLDISLATHPTASEAFCALVMQHALEDAVPHTFLGCPVSASTDAGETDLLFVVRLNIGKEDRLALMLEEETDAALQPEQASRYRQRGEQGVLDGGWDAYCTCLVAPAAYIARILQQDEWNGYLALEKIMAWARAVSGPHELVLAQVCAQAVAKHADGTSKISSEATAFWQACCEAAKEPLPDRTCRLPQYPAA